MPAVWEVDTIEEAQDQIRRMASALRYAMSRLPVECKPIETKLCECGHYAAGTHGKLACLECGSRVPSTPTVEETAALYEMGLIEITDEEAPADAEPVTSLPEPPSTP